MGIGSGTVSIEKVLRVMLFLSKSFSLCLLSSWILRTMEKPNLIAAEIVDFFKARPYLEGLYIAAPLEERPLIDAIKSSIGGVPSFPNDFS